MKSSLVIHIRLSLLQAANLTHWLKSEGINPSSVGQVAKTSLVTLLSALDQEFGDDEEEAALSYLQTVLEDKPKVDIKGLKKALHLDPPHGYRSQALDAR